MLDRTPPTHVKANGWHVQDVNVFLNDKQIVGDGVDSRFAMWTEVNASQFWAERFSDTGRNEKIRVYGIIRVEWNAAYKKKLAREDMDIAEKDILVAGKALGWDVRIKRHVHPQNNRGPYAGRDEVMGWLRASPKYDYGHASVLESAMTKFGKAMDNLGTSADIYFDAPAAKQVFPFAFTEEAQKSYAGRNYPWIGFDEADWVWDSFFGVPLKEIKATKFCYTPENVYWVDDNTVKVPLKTNSSDWTKLDEELVKDMLHSGTGSTAHGYVLMPDGHMSFVSGAYQGGFDKMTTYEAFNVYRNQQGEFRVLVPKEKGSDKLVDRRFNLCRLVEQGAGTSQKIVTDLDEKLAQARQSNSTLLAQNKTLTEQHARQANTILELVPKIRKLEEEALATEKKLLETTQVMEKLAGIVYRLKNALRTIRGSGHYAPVLSWQKALSNVKQIARDALDNPENQL